MNIGAFLLTNFFNGVLAVFLLLIGFKVFDRITPKWDFQEAFHVKGISGGALIVSAFLLGLSLVLAAGSF